LPTGVPPRVRTNQESSHPSCHASRREGLRASANAAASGGKPLRRLHTPNYKQSLHFACPFPVSTSITLKPTRTHHLPQPSLPLKLFQTPPHPLAHTNRLHIHLLQPSCLEAVPLLVQDKQIPMRRSTRRWSWRHPVDKHIAFGAQQAMAVRLEPRLDPVQNRPKYRERFVRRVQVEADGCVGTGLGAAREAKGWRCLRFCRQRLVTCAIVVGGVRVYCLVPPSHPSRALCLRG